MPALLDIITSAHETIEGAFDNFKLCQEKQAMHICVLLKKIRTFILIIQNLLYITSEIEMVILSLFSKIYSIFF